MVSEKTEKKWKVNAERKKEMKESVINFITLMMEEYDINTYDLE